MALILSYVAWILLAIVSLPACVVLVSVALPHFLLQPQYQGRVPADRGIKKYRFPQGRAVVYQPAMHSRAYVEQYLLSAREGKKYITVRFRRGSWLLRYHVMAFDADNRLLKVIERKETVTPYMTVKELPLPPETAYTNLCVREVNGELQSVPDLAVYTFKQIGIYAGATVLCTVIEALLLQRVMLMIAESLLPYSQTATGLGLGFAVLSAIVVGVIASALNLYIRLSSDIRIAKQ